MPPGNLPSAISERDIEDEFIRFGVLRSVWIARKPPGFGESPPPSLTANTPLASPVDGDVLLLRCTYETTDAHFDCVP